MTEHYFTNQPQTAQKLYQVQVSLAGKDLTLQTANSVFSTQGLDRGTAVLLQETAPVSSGHVLDLGCGWGAISIDTALTSPETTVWALDINQRALDLLTHNAQALQLSNIHPVLADQIPDNIQFQQIRSNPPIRVGKQVLHQLLRTWLMRLAPGGFADLVVAKKLGANSLESWLASEFHPDFSVARIARDKGFHILRVQRIA